MEIPPFLVEAGSRLFIKLYVSWTCPELAAQRIQRDELLKPEILRVSNENYRVYGVRNIWRI